MDLPQPGRTDGLAIGETTSVGVYRQPAVDSCFALEKHLLLFAVFTEAVLRHMHDLGARLRIL